MGLIDNIWQILRGKQGTYNPFFIKSIDGYSISTNIDTSTVNGQLLAYLSNPFVNSIIDKKTELFMNAKMFINDSTGNESRSKEATTLRELLKNPNGFQNGNEFIKNVYRNCQIFGGAYILPIDLGLNKIQGFVCLLNSSLNIEYDYSLYPNKIEKTNYIKRLTLTTFNGSQVDLTDKKDSILMIKLSESLTKPCQFQSKLASLSDQINTLNVGCDASLNLLRNHGAMMIVTNKSKDVSGTMPLTSKEKDNFYNDYYQNFGVNTGKKGVMFTSHDLGVVKVSMPISELRLDESEIRAVRTISEALNYPMILLGFSQGTTYSNVKEAKLSVYENAIIPEADLIYKSFETYLKTDNIKVYFDHLQIFQESELQKIEKNKLHIEIGKQLYDNGIYTLEQYKKYLIENEIIAE